MQFNVAEYLSNVSGEYPSNAASISFAQAGWRARKVSARRLPAATASRVESDSAPCEFRANKFFKKFSFAANRCELIGIQNACVFRNSLADGLFV